MEILIETLPGFGSTEELIKILTNVSIAVEYVPLRGSEREHLLEYRNAVAKAVVSDWGN